MKSALVYGTNSAVVPMGAAATAAQFVGVAAREIKSALNYLAIQIGQMKIVDAAYGERLTDLEAWRLAHAIAEIGKLGLMQPDGATISIKSDGTISVAQGPHWLLGEFYFFRHPIL